MLKAPVKGVGLALFGAACVTLARLFETCPWAPWVGVGIGGLVLVWWVYDAWTDKQTLGAVVKSVDAGKATLAADARETMGKVMEAVQVRGSAVEAAVKKAKEV